MRLLNYYTGEQLEIPLDPRLDQNANAQRYFKEYRKLTVLNLIVAVILGAMGLYFYFSTLGVTA